MNAKTVSWLAWLLPLLVSSGMALGALLGMTFSSDAARQAGPAGDMAGAAGALIILICILVGIVMSLLTVILAKILRRHPPERLLLRFVLSIAAGVLIGIIAPSSEGVTTVASWILLLSVPVMLSWSWSASCVQENKPEK